MIDFSVVIPVYNGAKSIEKLIENIEKELVNNEIQIILVNDGSKDNSAQVCKELSKIKKNIKFINLRLVFISNILLLNVLIF